MRHGKTIRSDKARQGIESEQDHSSRFRAQSPLTFRQPKTRLFPLRMLISVVIQANAVSAKDVEDNAARLRGCMLICLPEPLSISPSFWLLAHLLSLSSPDVALYLRPHSFTRPRSCVFSLSLQLTLSFSVLSAFPHACIIAIAYTHSAGPENRETDFKTSFKLFKPEVRRRKTGPKNQFQS